MLLCLRYVRVMQSSDAATRCISSSSQPADQKPKNFLISDYSRDYIHSNRKKNFRKILTVSEIVVENSSLVIVTIAQGLVDAIAIVFEEVVCSWRLIVLVWF